MDEKDFLCGVICLIWRIFPEQAEEMTEEEIIVWYLEQVPLVKECRVKSIEKRYEDFSSFCSLIKQTAKKRIPQMVVIGVASPTSVREAFGRRDMKMETGILMQKAEAMP